MINPVVQISISSWYVFCLVKAIGNIKVSFNSFYTIS